jgi:REP element-mobilizing transposase RayT
MVRPLRIEYSGAFYHVTSRGNGRQRIFLDDRDRKDFLNLLFEKTYEAGAKVYAFVLMDNHYHLLLETMRVFLSEIMRQLNGIYTQHFNRHHRRVGHLFQGRYKAILVEKDSYLLELSRYLHLNPVRAGIVNRPQDYRWSSYLKYLGKADKFINDLKTDWFLSLFGDDLSKSRKRYQEFVEEGLRQRARSPFKDVIGQIFLGGEEFVEGMKDRLLGKDIERSEVPALKELEDHIPIPVIIETIGEYFSKKKEEFLKASGKARSEVRDLAIYLASVDSGWSEKSIGELFGGISYSAVSKALGRLRERRDKESDIRKKIEEIRGKYSQFKT